MVGICAGLQARGDHQSLDSASNDAPEPGQDNGASADKQARRKAKQQEKAKARKAQKSAKRRENGLAEGDGQPQAAPKVQDTRNGSEGQVRTCAVCVNTSVSIHPPPLFLLSSGKETGKKTAPSTTRPAN